MRRANRLKQTRAWRWGLVILLAVLAVAGTRQKPPRLAFQEVSRLAVWHGGRVKALDTMAREMLTTLSGRTVYHGSPAVQVLLEMWMGDRAWRHEKIILVDQPSLRNALALPEARRRFSYQELSASEALPRLAHQAAQQAAAGTTPDPGLREARVVVRRLALLDAIQVGEVMRLAPDPRNPEGTWVSPVVLAATPPTPATTRALAAYQQLIRAYRDVHPEAFDAAAVALRTAIAETAPNRYPALSVLERELGYHRFKPFRKAWMLYLLAFIGLLYTDHRVHPDPRRVFLLVLFIGWSIHSWGILQRCLIAGRPPVTNMYESVVWACWGAVFFALVFEITGRGRGSGLAIALPAAIGLLLVDSLPTVFDPYLAPLSPVLQHNGWLTLHVVTITLGYAAFALALGAGHLYLVLLAVPTYPGRLETCEAFLEKTLRLGVVLLAAGILFGGAWAHVAWGRFWGWDPKETWALVALLVYLAALHARLAGWLGGTGQALVAILGFLAVLMAWYGVNFVLGDGLHSYGFGGGGLPYVLMYVATELLLVGGVLLRLHFHHKVNLVREFIPEERPS